MIVNISAIETRFVAAAGACVCKVSTDSVTTKVMGAILLGTCALGAPCLYCFLNNKEMYTETYNMPTPEECRKKCARLETVSDYAVRRYIGYSYEGTFYDM